MCRLCEEPHTARRHREIVSVSGITFAGEEIRQSATIGIQFHRMGTAMTNSFLAAVRSTLSTIDAGIARVILLFWISTLQEQRRHERRLRSAAPVVNLL
jgi:hypothetical protein